MFLQPFSSQFFQDSHQGCRSRLMGFACGQGRLYVISRLDCTPDVSEYSFSRQQLAFLDHSCKRAEINTILGCSKPPGIHFTSTATQKDARLFPNTED